MDTSTIILICTNILVPLLVAGITAIAQSKKYKKEIDLINAEHEQKMKEQKAEFDHQIEMLKLEQKHQQEMESQKMGNSIVELLADKLSDEIIKQPATQRMIQQKTTRSYARKRR